MAQSTRYQDAFNDPDPAQQVADVFRDHGVPLPDSHPMVQFARNILTPMYPPAPQSPDAQDRNAQVNAAQPDPYGGAYSETGIPQNYGQGTPPPSNDPYAGLSGLQNVLGGAGQVAGNVMGAVSNLPVIGGALQGAGQFSTAIAGLPAKAYGDQSIQDAYAAARRTNEGGAAGLFDIPAEVRGLAAAEQARQQQLAGMAGNTDLSPQERAKAAAGAGIYGALPYVIPVPGAAEVGGLARAGLKAGAQTVADAARPGLITHALSVEGAQIEGGPTNRIGANPEAVVRPGDAIADTSAAQTAASRAIADEAAKATPPEPRDYAGNLDLNTLNAPADVKDLIRQTYEANPDPIEAIRAIGQAHGETVAKAQASLDLARATGMEPGEFIASLRANAEKTPEQLVASKMAINQAAQDAMAAHAEFIRTPDSPTLEARALKSLAAEVKAQADLAGIVASSGRTLEANKILAGISDFTTEGTPAKLVQAKRLLFGLHGSEKYDAFANEFVRLDPNDVPTVNKFIRDTVQALQDVKTRSAPAPDVGWWFRHNLNGALLSGTTAPAVTGSYILKAARNVAEQYGAAGLQAIGLGRAQGVGGLVPRFDLPRTQTLAEANAYALGATVRGTGHGFATFLNDFVHRQSTRALSEAASSREAGEFDRYPTFNPARPGSKFPALTPGDLAGFGAARAADVVGGFTRLVGSVEDAFKTSFTDGYLARDLSVQARQRGLQGAQRDAFIAEGLRNPDYATFKRASDAAGFNTYQFRKAGPRTQDAIDFRDKMLGAPGRMLFPFLNAPVNILRDAIQSTPAGLPGVGAAVKKLSGGRYGEFFPEAPGLENATEGSVRLARAMIGTVGMATIASKMAAGDITGFNPYRRGSTEGDAWDAQHPEFSVRIGQDAAGRDRWLALDRIPPIAQMVKLIAGWQDVQRQNPKAEIGDLVKLGAGRAARTLFDETWFTSLSNVMSAIENPERHLKTLISSLATENIPLSGRLRVINHELGVPPTDPQTWQDYLKQGIPGLAQQVPARQGLPGPEQPKYNTGILAELPWRLAVDHAARIQFELVRLKSAGFTIPEPITSTDAGLGQKFTEDEVRNLRKIAYPKILDAVERTLSGTEYKSASDAAKHVLLTQAVDLAHRAAKMEFARDQMLARSDQANVTRAALVGLGTLDKMRDRAQWVDFLNRAGKLTPATAQAIDASRPLISPSHPIQDPSAQDYLKAAPLIREYLAHPPYGTDAHPIGTPQDWQAVEVARKHESERKAELMSGGTPSAIAAQRAKIEAARALPQIQRGILLNGPAMENPARRLLLLRHPEVARLLTGTTTTQVVP